jgi:general secretion pathway protein A
MMSLGQTVDSGASYVQIFRVFQDFLIDEYAQGRRTALIFDEAQNLTPETLEELRMFSNINADKDELLQLILVGQPELRDLVHRPELQQFAQRIASEFHLRALDAEETCQYIDHRMSVGGATRKVFDPQAGAMIYVACRGVPRLINQLCDYALVYGLAEEKPEIDVDIVRDVLEDRLQFGVFSDPGAPADACQTAVPAPTLPPALPEGSSPPAPGPTGVDGGENVFYGVWGERKV